MKEKVFTRHGKLKGLGGCQKDAKYWIAENSNIKVLGVRIVLTCKSKRAENLRRPRRMLRTKPLHWLPDLDGSKGSLNWDGGVEGVEGCPKEISSWVDEHPDIEIKKIELSVLYDGGEMPRMRRMLRILNNNKS